MPQRAETARSDSELAPLSPKRRRWRWPIFAAFAVLLLAGGAIAYWQFSKTKVEPPPSPEIKVPPPESQTKDTDKDGLSDDEEAKLGTKPNKPDSDADGLADGDEVNIFKSDPLLFDTDNDGFVDGSEVAFNYSPLSASREKAGAEEIQSWTATIAKYGLHEPSISTLKIKTSGSLSESKSSYVNAGSGYSVDLPSLLAYREADEGRNTGIYVTGTTPTDSEVLTDPISISVAVRVEGQSLSDWVKTLYRAGTDYRELREEIINSLPAIRLLDMPGEACEADRVFFAKENRVIILTWTCNDFEAYRELYEEIVQSFKFL